MNEYDVADYRAIECMFPYKVMLKQDKMINSVQAKQERGWLEVRYGEDALPRKALVLNPVVPINDSGWSFLFDHAAKECTYFFKHAENAVEFRLAHDDIR